MTTNNEENKGLTIVEEDAFENEITDEDREKEAKTIQEDINEVSEGDDNDENYSDVTHQENN